MQGKIRMSTNMVLDPFGATTKTIEADRAGITLQEIADWQKPATNHQIELAGSEDAEAIKHRNVGIRSTYFSSRKDGEGVCANRKCVQLQTSRLHGRFFPKSFLTFVMNVMKQKTSETIGKSCGMKMPLKGKDAEGNSQYGNIKDYLAENPDKYPDGAA